MTEIFGFLYRMFSPRHKQPPDEYDEAYATFVDSILEDVRFIVCIRRREPSSERATGCTRRLRDPNTAGSEAATNDYIRVPHELERQRKGTTTTTTPTMRSVTNCIDFDNYDDDEFWELHDEMEFDNYDLVHASGSARATGLLPNNSGGGGGGGGVSVNTKSPLTFANNDRSNELEHVASIEVPAESTPIKGALRRTLSDYFVTSPMPGEAAPDASSQDGMQQTSMTETASSVASDYTVSVPPVREWYYGLTQTGPGEQQQQQQQQSNDEDSNPLERMPVVMLYEPKSATGKILGYETETVLQRAAASAGGGGGGGGDGRTVEMFEPGKRGNFVIDGLFDEPAPKTCRNENLIEITYAVRPLRRTLSFTAIGVFNDYLKTHGDRGRVRFDMHEFISAIRSFDSTARLVNPNQLDLYSFEIDLSSLHLASLLKSKRKFFLRFSKRV